MEALKLSENQDLKPSFKQKLNLISRKVQNTLTFQSLKVYDSLEVLKILTFWKINQTGNVFLLDKDFFEGKLYTEKESLHIQETWLRLQDEYYKIQNDPKQRAKIRVSKERMLLQFKVQTLISHLEFYERFFKYADLLDTKSYVEQENKLFELFKELGLNKKVSPFASPEEKLNLVSRYVSSVFGKLKRLNKEVEKESGEQIDNMYIQVVSIEKVIERPIPNIEDITVMQWIAYEQQANEIIKAHKKVNNGKK